MKSVDFYVKDNSNSLSTNNNNNNNNQTTTKACLHLI